MVALAGCEAAPGPADTVTQTPPHLQPTQSSAVQETRGSTESPNELGLCLRLIAPRASVTLGEPVILLVVLSNCSPEPRVAEELIAPEYGFLHAWIKRPGEEPETLYRPAVKRDARGKRPRTLAPGESLSAWLHLYVSAEGWVLNRPGRYRVRAEYAVDKTTIRAEPIALEVEAPSTAADRAAAELMMSHATARLLLTGDERSGEAAKRMQRIASEHASSPLAPFAQLSLGLLSTQEGFDPETKSFRSPDCERAVPLLGEAVKRLKDPIFAATGTRTLARCLRTMGRGPEADRAVAAYAHSHPEAARLPGVANLLKQDAAKSY